MKQIFFFLSLCSLCAAQNFYDYNKIQKIEISFNQPNWDYILDTAKQGSDGYLLSKWVKINGQQLDSAGVKYKGNSSYNPNNAKNSLHIELDHFKNQNYIGFKDIKLNNGYNEPSFVRETVLYGLFQNYLKAPRANYAQVYINGQYMGIYTNVEAITKTFLEDRFYSNKNTFVFADLGGCDLRYKGADTALYYTPYTMKSDYGYTHLKRLCDTLRNNSGQIENILDVDRTLWLHAFNNVFLILDSYSGNSKHNYYLYRDHNGRFNPIPWDLNGGFGTYAKINAGPPLNFSQLQNLTPLLHMNDTAWPLIRNLLINPMYKRMYIAHMKTIVSENLANNFYYTFAQALQGIADTAVLSDPNKFGTYAQFLANLNGTVAIGTRTIPGLAHMMGPRLSYLNSTPEFTAVAPTITNVAASNNAPLMNSSVTITAAVSNATVVYLGKRASVMDRFYRTQMYDDGLHGDGAAGDGVYGATLTVSSQQTQYYIYAENAAAGKFSPERAEHEYHKLNTLGNPLPGQIVINEFLAVNQNDVKNEFNQYEDWIELYNNTGNPLNLNGYYISDDYGNKNKFPFPSGTTIAPYSYLMIWADGQITGTNSIHASFKLSQGGEQIMLSNGSNIVIDSVSFGPQSADVSLGRCPNGTGPFVTFNLPTYGSSNCVVSLKELAMAEKGLLIYPNPASRQATIIYRGAEAPDHLLMYDISGRVVYQSGFKGEHQIPAEAFDAGIYLLQLRNSQGVAASARLQIIR